MKNLHLLATEKPSRLHFDSELFLTPNIQLSKEINSIVEGRNIYITSDEELKDGYWCLDLDTFKVFKLGNWNTNRAKKIILTTDPTLISDGVQAISDDFLEWFVKNPSCKQVDLEKIDSEIPKKEVDGYFSNETFLYYKIIIPQEEPKQETLEGFIKKSNTPEGLDQFSYDKGLEDGAKWQSEQLFKDDAIQTLEKCLALLLKKQEKMYSEEEVLEMITMARKICCIDGNIDLDDDSLQGNLEGFGMKYTINQILEQFKKNKNGK